MIRKLSLKDRLLAAVVSDKNGCWLWQMGLFANGYGAIAVNRKTRKAHRVSFEVFKGQIPPGDYVCHKCDVPACVNPDHLFLGGAQTNNDDMRLKGRARYPGPTNPPKGTCHHKAILTENAVRRIRLVGNTVTQATLAQWFGVSTQTISAVLRREVWRTIA